MQVTLTATVNAAGEVAGIRIVHAGERILCGVTDDGKKRKYLYDLPDDTILGKINFSVTDSGYVIRCIFLLVLKDLFEFCVANNIKFPIVLFVDGFGGHFHMDITNYCREKQIVLLGKIYID